MKGEIAMIKTHKVGTVTLGTMLIVFGILFLLRIFITDITYEFIFKLWPIIFVFLGLEILIRNFSQKDEKFIYDKGAVVLIILLSFFAMSMAASEFFINYANSHIVLQSYPI